MILKFVDDNGNTAKVKLTPGGDRNLVIKMMEEKYGFRLVGKSAQHPLKPTPVETDKPLNVESGLY